jgi:hypothetical protein
MTRENGIFPETPWGDFLWQQAARRKNRQQAVSVFCRLYWKPIFNLLRSRHVDPTEAEDLTQGFLLHFIQNNSIARADPSKGRFRDFLCASLNNYLANEQARARTLKRGGGFTPVDLDEVCRTNNSAFVDASHRGPDCDALWVARLLQRVRAKLEMEYAREGRGLMFRLLLPHINGHDPLPYWKLALRLRRDAATLRSDVKRLRRRFRESVEEELRRRAGAERASDALEVLREILRGK